MKIKPVLHRVLIKPDELEEKTASGLIIKFDEREKSAVETGMICDIGSTVFKDLGSTTEIEGIKIGSKVYFAKYAGKEIKIEGVRHLLLNDEDIVGVFTDE